MTPPAQALVFVAAGLLAAAVAGPLGAWCARRGWTDPPADGAAIPERKRGQVPQPLTGGLVLALAAAVAAASGRLAPLEILFAAGAFVLGRLDDRRAAGLAPLPKVLGQLLVATPLAAAWWTAPPLGAGGAAGAAAAFGLAFVALNAVNLWDHADGLAACLVAVAGAAAGAPVVGGAAAGVLARQLRPPASGRPFLGDGGSHLAGALLVCWPAAWPLLGVPLADALRVAVARALRGHPPWRGDRGHAGHLLAARGWSPGRQCLVLAALLGALAVGARLAAA